MLRTVRDARKDPTKAYAEFDLKYKTYLHVAQLHAVVEALQVRSLEPILRAKLKSLASSHLVSAEVSTTLRDDFGEQAASVKFLMQTPKSPAKPRVMKAFAELHASHAWIHGESLCTRCGAAFPGCLCEEEKRCKSASPTPSESFSGQYNDRFVVDNAPKKDPKCRFCAGVYTSMCTCPTSTWNRSSSDVVNSDWEFVEPQKKKKEYADKGCRKGKGLRNYEQRPSKSVSFAKLPESVSFTTTATEKEIVMRAPPPSPVIPTFEDLYARTNGNDSRKKRSKTREVKEAEAEPALSPKTELKKKEPGCCIM